MTRFICLYFDMFRGNSGWQLEEAGRGNHNKFHQTQNVISSLARIQNHPDEKKSRHLKVSDMCHRCSHWATVPDVARNDSIQAIGTGCGTFKVWCVSHLILVMAHLESKKDKWTQAVVIVQKT